MRRYGAWAKVCQTRRRSVDVRAYVYACAWAMLQHPQRRHVLETMSTSKARIQNDVSHLDAQRRITQRPRPLRCFVGGALTHSAVPVAAILHLTFAAGGC